MLRARTGGLNSASVPTNHVPVVSPPIYCVRCAKGRSVLVHGPARYRYCTGDDQLSTTRLLVYDYGSYLRDRCLRPTSSSSFVASDTADRVSRYNRFTWSWSFVLTMEPGQETCFLRPNSAKILLRQCRIHKILPRLYNTPDSSPPGEWRRWGKEGWLCLILHVIDFLCILQYLQLHRWTMVLRMRHLLCHEDQTVIIYNSSKGAELEEGKLAYNEYTCV